MSTPRSYRQILSSSYIIGGASLVNILVGLARIKLAAVLIGPAGVGLIGIFQSLMQTASTIAGLGFGNVGTRQIAEAHASGAEQAVLAARRALFIGSLALACAGGLVFWTVRRPLSEHVLGNSSMSSTVGWLALGVALLVVAAGQSALLNGMRRIRDIASTSVLSAVFSTIIGSGALLLYGSDAVWTFVIAAPLCTVIVGRWYVARVPKVIAQPAPMSALLEQWKTLARLGAAFTLAALVANGAQLIVRALVQHSLGEDAVGIYQAAAQISMTYLGFVLTAMGTDYYPRLTATIHVHDAANRMVNEQTEIALLLAGSVLLGMMGFAPWMIDLLYSSRFHEAAGILRWQIIGDALKILSWPLGFLLLSAGAGRYFLFAETLAYGFFAAITWIGLPRWGVSATGIGFVGMYIVYLPVVYFLAWRQTRLIWTLRVLWQGVGLLALLTGVMLCAEYSIMSGAVAGFLGASAWGLYSAVQLTRMGAVPERIGRICFKVSGYLGTSDQKLNDRRSSVDGSK